MISAMTCGVIFMVVFQKSLSVRENIIRQTLGGYYILMILMWFLTIVSMKKFEGKLLLVPLLFLLIHLSQVVFFHFISYVIPTKKRFNTLHYLVATVIFIMLTILVYLVDTTDGFKQIDLEHFFHQYIYIYTSIITVYYITLGWWQLYVHNKGKENNKKLNITWIHILFILRTTFAILFIFNNYRMGLIQVILVLLIASQHILLTYNVLQKNIIDKISSQYKTNIMLVSGQIISVNDNGIVEQPVKENYSIADKETNTLLTQQAFIDYFSTHKPYLNKDFKLDDLVKHFGLNRTYINSVLNA